MKQLTPDIIFDDEHRGRNLKKRSARGGLISISTQAILFILRLAGITVLARLLTPDDYGLVAMAAVIIGIGDVFKDAGLSTATIQRDEISKEQISTLFWLNVLISVGIGTLIAVCAPAIAWFYGRSELTAISVALSVSFIIKGLMIQHRALLARRLHFGKIAIARIGAQVIATIATIALALSGWGYWALVANAIILAASETLLTFYLCPWMPSRLRRASGVLPMVKFGADITGSSFVNFLARNMDNVLVGKFLGSNALGLYSKAYQLFMMPIRYIRGPMLNVALPVLSSLKSQPERYARYYGRLVEIMAMLTMPVAVYCAIEAEFVIRLLLGNQWLEAVPVFRVLAILGAVQSVTSTQGLVTVSCGHSRRYFWVGAALSVASIGSFIAGLPFGILGVALAYVIVNLVLAIPSLLVSFHNTPVNLRLFFASIGGSLGLSTTAAATAMLVRHMTSPGTLVGNVVFLCVFALVYAGGSLCRPTVRETVALFAASLRPDGEQHDNRTRKS